MGINFAIIGGSEAEKFLTSKLFEFERVGIKETRFGETSPFFKASCSGKEFVFVKAVRAPHPPWRIVQIRHGFC